VALSNKPGSSTKGRAVTSRGEEGWKSRRRQGGEVFWGGDIAQGESNYDWGAGSNCLADTKPGRAVVTSGKTERVAAEHRGEYTLSKGSPDDKNLDLWGRLQAIVRWIALQNRTTKEEDNRHIKGKRFASQKAPSPRGGIIARIHINMEGTGTGRARECHRGRLAEEKEETAARNGRRFSENQES